MEAKDKRYRSLYFERFSKQKPTIEALPILRQAVLQDDHVLVKCAAVAIGKFKEKAASATEDLLKAAANPDNHGLPQSYSECLAALVVSQTGYCPKPRPSAALNQSHRRTADITAYRLLYRAAT
jgi:hypothetical protein